MHRFSQVVLASVAGVLLMAGCEVQAPDDDRAGEAAPVAEPVDTATPPLAIDLLIRSEGEALNFDWLAPPVVALEPALLADIRLDAENMRSAAARRAADDRALAGKNDYPFHGYELNVEWRVAAETERLMALTATLYEYTGGAHGMTNYKTIIYDRKHKKQIALDELVTDRDAFFEALTPEWCEALNDERRHRRGEARLDGSFNDCPRLAEMVVVPEGRGHIFGFRVIAAPYVAGPYVEGSYEVTLSVPDVEKFIQPRYQGAFSEN